MFETNANKEHALKGIGKIKMSNLCTVIENTAYVRKRA